MKKFILKNAMALVAMAIAAGSYGLMSFTHTESNDHKQSTYWYPVDPSGVISGSPIPKPNSPECNSNNTQTVCGAELTVPMFEGTLSEAHSLGLTTGQFTRRADQ